MNRASIREYVESAQSIIEDSPQMGEATTKAAILRDFIELLNWEIPTNTELEYSVKAFGKTYKVDYALLLNERPVAFLEAKGLDTSLTDSHREQLSEYLRSEDVDWGILTNGREYEFYQRRVIDSRVEVELIEQTALDQLSHKSSILEAYQTETIRRNESKDIIEHLRQLRHSRETLINDKEELATAVVELLSESASEVIAPSAESQAKEMIDRLIADINSKVDTDARTQPDVHSSPEAPEKDQQTSSESYSVSIIQNDDEIETFDGTVQSDLMATVVNYLIQQHGLISAIEPLPYIPGKKRAIVNSEPTYDGTEMAQPRELEQGYYLEVNLSWGQKQRELQRMAKACGLEATVEKTDES